MDDDNVIKFPSKGGATKAPPPVLDKSVGARIGELEFRTSQLIQRLIEIVDHLESHRETINRQGVQISLLQEELRRLRQQ